MITENQLALFNERNRQGFDAVFSCYYKDLYLYVNNKINSETDADEITSDVFIALHESPEKFDKVENLKAYLYCLAKNRCVNFSITRERQQERIKGSMPQNNDDENSDSLIPNDIQVLTGVITIIKELPGKYGQVARHLSDNLTPKEVADKMNISMDMVYKLRDWAVKRIQQRLREI
jgi:RNA polymerase sigma-70 factor, ECF subfamily